LELLSTSRSAQAESYSTLNEQHYNSLISIYSDTCNYLSNTDLTTVSYVGASL